MKVGDTVKVSGGPEAWQLDGKSGVITSPRQDDVKSWWVKFDFDAVDYPLFERELTVRK